MKTPRDHNYALRARRRFCGRLRTTPFELVLSGKRSLEEWIEVLAEERTRRERLSPHHAASLQDDFKQLQQAGGRYEN